MKNHFFGSSDGAETLAIVSTGEYNNLVQYKADIDSFSAIGSLELDFFRDF